MQEGLTYNTNREDIKIPEYGRNVKNMIDYAITIEDREKRNKVAKAIISVMGLINPSLRDIEDYNHKLWDHLFIISNFKLDVDSPYPIPKEEDAFEKPEQLAYSKEEIKYAYYGKSISRFIEATKKMPEGQKREAMILETANLMKRAFLIWNKDFVENDVIAKHLKELSGGELILKDTDDMKTYGKVPGNNKGGQRKYYNKNKKRNQKNRKKR